MSSDRPRRRWFVGSAAIAVLIFAIGWGLLISIIIWHENQPSPRPSVYIPPIYAWYAVAPLFGLAALIVLMRNLMDSYILSWAIVLITWLMAIIGSLAWLRWLVKTLLFPGN